MKRLKQKKGFTLVECVVAMAVLMIMSLLLSMLLNVTILTRNENMELERDIDGQVNNIAANAPDAQLSQYNDDIQFTFDDKSFSIPGNGSGVKANKKSYEHEVEIGVVDYNFENFFADLPMPEELGGGADATVNRGDIGGKVGEVNLLNSSGASSVNITPHTIPITETDADGNTVITGYTINLDVSFTAYYATPERSLKIILPIGAEYIGCSSATNCVVDSSAKYSVRIQPGSDRSTGGSSSGDGKGGYVDGGMGVSASFSFEISKEDYDNFYQDHGLYFKGQTSPDGTTMGVTL